MTHPVVGNRVALRFRHKDKFGRLGVVKDAVMQEVPHKEWLFTIKLETGEMLRNVERVHFERVGAS